MAKVYRAKMVYIDGEHIRGWQIFSSSNYDLIEHWNVTETIEGEWRKSKKEFEGEGRRFEVRADYTAREIV